MNYLRTFILFFILTSYAVKAESFSSSKQKYNLTVVCIFFNEADYLKEWIDYHLLVGVEHFYLYNNNSNDHYLDVLDPYINNGRVEITDWPSPPEKNWSSYQRQAYRHCVDKKKQETTWMAFIDTDEFIVPLSHASIPEFLEEYKNYGGVYISWQCYGTSYLPSIPEGKLLIESLTLKYSWDCKKNSLFKTIAQPKHIKDCYIHDCSFKKGYFCVTPSLERKMPLIPDIDKIRINHYWTRAEDFFYNIKIPRIERYSHKKVTQETIDTILRDSNSVEDLTILPFATKLKKIKVHDE